MGKREIPTTILVRENPHLSPIIKPSLYRSIRNKTCTIIVLISSGTAAILPFLPYEEIDGNRIPTIIFKRQASTFHLFVVSTMFAFSTSFSTFFLHNKPKLASFCRYYSLLSVGSAVIMLLSARLSVP